MIGGWEKTFEILFLNTLMVIVRIVIVGDSYDSYTLILGS